MELYFVIELSAAEMKSCCERKNYSKINKTVNLHLITIYHFHFGG